MDAAETIKSFGQKFLKTEIGLKLLPEDRVIALKQALAPLCAADDLNLLAYLFETDKYGYHNYIPFYQRHFAPLREKALNILEIGVGGDDTSSSGGRSLRMWKRYFPKSNIFGIDIHDKTGIEEARIKTFKGDQGDTEFLSMVAEKIGQIDIIIDDGSHMNRHVIASFEYLFPILAPNGIYVVEDVQTSYWANFGGSTTNLSSDKTMVGYFKKLVDGLNYQDMVPTPTPTYFDSHITEICFYHNMIFIQKGLNNEAPGTFHRPTFDEQNDAATV